MKIKDQERLMTAVQNFLNAEAAHAAVLAMPRPKTTKAKAAERANIENQARAQLRIAIMALRETYAEIDKASRS